jgi:hypothetical protein
MRRSDAERLSFALSVGAGFVPENRQLIGFVVDELRERDSADVEG